MTSLSSGRYVYDDGYLSTTSKANEVLFGGVTVTVRGNKPANLKKEKLTKKRTEEGRYALSEGLFLKLKELRLSIASEEKVPAFVIFSDATLVDMCQKHPQTDEEMLSVSGVGKVKMERYGERFLALLREEEPNTESKEGSQELTDGLFFECFEIEDNHLQISRVADNINAVLIRYGKTKTSGMKLNKLLMEAGYMEAIDSSKLPTETGRELGIITVERHSERGNYMQCLFGEAAQRVCGELIMNTLSDDV